MGKSGRKKRKITFAEIFVIVTGTITIFMVLFIFSLSFFSNSELSYAYGSALDPGLIPSYSRFKLIPDQISIEQYVDTLWNNSDYWYYFWNSVRICLPIILGTCVVGTLGGYAFAKFNFRGKKIFLFLFILFMMMPYQVMIPSQFRELYNTGLLNTHVSIVLPYIFIPFSTYLIYQYTKKIPEECFEAARMDGAGEVKIFLYIAVPNIKNGITALAILTLIDTWNIIEQALAFLNDEYKYPLSAAMNQIGITNNMSLLVSCVMSMIPVFLVFMLGKEQLIEGIGQSVVKKG